MKVILAVMCTTWAVVKIRPEKNSGLYGQPEFFSGLFFTTAEVVHLTARITFIHIYFKITQFRFFKINAVFK